jgi:hypothetical protein
MTEVRRQIQALAGAFAVPMAEAALPEGVTARFDRGLAGLSDAPLAPPPAGCDPSVSALRHWEAAIRAVRGGPAAALAPSLEALAPALRWTQNPNYRAAPPAPDFLANYGYAQLAGPSDVPTLLATDTLAFGLLLLGAGLLYPSHRHPAAEIYLPLTAAAWQRGDEGWRRVPAGEPIYHPPHLAHATRAGENPLLALYLWQGDLATPARIGGGGGPVG